MLEGILVLEEILELEDDIPANVLEEGILTLSHIGLIDYGCPLLR